MDKRLSLRKIRRTYGIRPHHNRRRGCRTHGGRYRRLGRSESSPAGKDGETRTQSTHHGQGTLQPDEYQTRRRVPRKDTGQPGVLRPCLCGVRQQGTRKILREARGTALHRTGRTRIPQKRQGMGYRRSTRGVVSGGGRGDNLSCGRLRDTAARQPGARRQLQDEKGIPPTGGSPGRRSLYGRCLLPGHRFHG